jgi:D-tyrosyl-tRNA(Tyr) deacylase
MIENNQPERRNKKEIAPHNNKLQWQQRRLRELRVVAHRVMSEGVLRNVNQNVRMTGGHHIATKQTQWPMAHHIAFGHFCCLLLCNNVETKAWLARITSSARVEL